PILTVPGVRGGGMADTVAYVTSVEQLLIDTLADLGFHDVGRLRGYPGLWFAPASDTPRKVAAIGVRLSRGRSMHGFALNVDPDMTMFDHIVPCGLEGMAVTSLAAEGFDGTMRDVVEALLPHAVARWGADGFERADVVWRERPDDLAPFTRAAHEAAEGAPTEGTPVRLVGRLAQAGVDAAAAVPLRERKPEWMRVQVRSTPAERKVRATVRELDLVTVCEEAGCPNLSECW